jgi:putative colanic acid biosynthesis UDP-glucose lipid carrier transferase
LIGGSYDQMVNTPIRAPTRRLLQDHDTLVVWFQRLFNSATVVGILVALAVWRDGELRGQYRYMAIVAMLLMLGIYEYAGVYRRYAGRVAGVQKLARAWGAVVMILGIVAFATKTSEVFSRQVIVLWATSTFLLQASMFVLTFEVARRLQARVAGVPSLLIGTGALAQHLAGSIGRNPWLPDRMVGTLSEHAGSNPHWGLQDVPVLGTTAELLDKVREHGIRRVYVALPLRLTHQVDEIQRLLFDCNVDIIWAPDIFALNLLNHSVREMAGVPLITLSETPLISGGRAFLKTVMDKVLASCALVLLSPLMLLVAAAIRLESGAPVLFRQPRHGWDGRVIEVYKFRSMFVHTEAPDQVTQAKRDDARITRVGRFIRRTSIDELPQLFNVLAGSMSLVGPRPHALAHNRFYSDKVRAYLARHRIKPGITGLAQINGCRGETDTLEKMQRRVEYDLEYINSWSPWLDIKILLLTPIALFSRNAY